MIAGHETPTDGDVRIDGERVIGLPPVQRGTAMMFQNYALFPHLTVLDNVAFNLKMRGVGKAERREQRARTCWRGCSWNASPTACRRSCPAASSSASRWPVR